MLITLIKIANKLDKLGEHELANELDYVIQELSCYATKKDKEKLIKDLKEIDKRLDAPNVSSDRIKELREAKKNIESDLEELEEE